LTDKPIIHGDRNIGDTVELIPGNAPGRRGPLKEIMRTQGEDDGAQLLTLTISGPPTYESSMGAHPLDSRGPLFAVVEWGIKGARAAVELDLPPGGLTMSVVASYLQISARYDGMVLLDGKPMDSRAVGGQNPGPRQRVGAFVGYGSYGRSSRLTRTFRLDSIPPAKLDDGVLPSSSPEIRVPAFARRVTITAKNPAGFGLTLFGPGNSDGLDSIKLADTIDQATVDLPGDCTTLVLDNYNLNANLVTPALTFEIAL
jgi:hypothetical protein